MPNAINWESNPSYTSYLTTGLNSLANGGNVLGAAIDNSTGLDTYCDVEVSLAAQGSARSNGAFVAVYLLPSGDGGTTYAYGDASTDPAPEHLAARVGFDAATTARDQVSLPFTVPPGHFKILVQNQTGQAFAASGSTVQYRLYSLEIQ